MKKIILSFVILLCLFSLIPEHKLWADEEETSNKEDNTNNKENDLEHICDPKREDYDAEDPKVKLCPKYNYEKARSTNKHIQELERMYKELDIKSEEARKAATKAKERADLLKIEINALNEQIKIIKEKIKVLNKEIEKNKTIENQLNERVLNRMRNAQKKMHFNPFLDFLLGASSFEDLNRRTYGLNALMSKDNDDRKKIIEILKKLENDRLELAKNEKALDEKIEVLNVKEAEVTAELKLYQKALDEINAEKEEVLMELEKEKRNYADLASRSDLSGLPSSAGLISPAPGASINAGTWYYPSSFGGGVHLGVDYGLGLGSSLYAPANGIVIVSSDGCEYGYLGDRCSGNGNGVAYGGNQVYIMVAANGSVYVVSFSHLLKGSPVGIGPIKQGDYVGKVGSSGNSTGPHCHVELFYLGEGEMEDIQNDYLKRNYSQSFNCGWGYSALDRLCENGVGAPCRLKPENYLGS